MPTPYATRTQVPVHRSRTEIEQLLQRFGADGFAYAWEGGQETVAFAYASRQVRLAFPIPKRESYRSEDAWQRERRRRWRTLVLTIKAILVAVEEGLLSFDEVFLAWFVMPDGQTIGEQVVPRLEAAAHRGELPALMPPAGGGRGSAAR